MQRARPYIGIVGMSSVSEMRDAALTIFNAMDEHVAIPHMGQLGVQVTDRTLHGEATDNLRCPKVSEIPGMFREALAIKDDLFTVIHYTTKQPEMLFRSVKNLFDIGGLYQEGLVQGLQLNGGFRRIRPDELQKIRDAYPDIRIILQCPRAYHSLIPEQISEGLKPMEQCVDYVLFDRSGGKGIPMDERDCQIALVQSMEILEKTRIAVGFAGGLFSENVERVVRRLFADLKDKNFSIDAEGGLRDKIGEGYGNDLFNPDKTDSYFLAAVRAFATCV